jgi:hypothetical protein
MGHPHHHIGAAAVVDGHALHPLAGVEPAEAIEAVGAGADAPVHPAGARLAAASIAAVDPRVQASAHHLGTGGRGETADQQGEQPPAQALGRNGIGSGGGSHGSSTQPGSVDSARDQGDNSAGKTRLDGLGLLKVNGVH